MGVKVDLKTYDLKQLGTKFDVLIIDPPWQEYHTRVGGLYVPREDLTPKETLRALSPHDRARSEHASAVRYMKSACREPQHECQWKFSELSKVSRSNPLFGFSARSLSNL